MRIRIRSDPLIFGPPDLDQVLISLDFHLEQNINQNLLKMMVYKVEFYIINIFFSSFQFKVGSGFFFPAEPDPDPWKKCRILIPA